MTTKRKAETECPVPAKVNRVEEVLSRGNNALMQLNEIGIKGLKWNIEQISNVFPQRFKATCIFTEPFTGLYEVIPTGVIFSCEGTNKSSCRHDIANQIMSRLSFNASATNTAHSMDTDNRLIIEIFPKTVNSVTNDVPKMEEAVRLLHEKVTDLEYNFTLTEEGYSCFVSFRGFMIKGTGSSKKIAKRNVAAQILKKYFQFSFFEDGEVSQSTNVDSTTTMEIDKLPFNRRKNFSNQIQAMVKNGFEKLVNCLDVQYSKRKVLSGVVLSRKRKVVFPDYTSDSPDPIEFYNRTGWTLNSTDGEEILKLVTLSSGTKCLSGNDINSEGNAVNDCHAEVISKRALQYFIHRVIERLLHNVHLTPHDLLYGTDILEIYNNDDCWTYKLMDDVKFHLYVSSSPCGDSRIFFPQTVGNVEESEEETDEDCHPNRKNRGVLRTKIECGEGTIPIKTKHIQTWDGILGGERLLTMSCSDKVCVWNVLGLQGALLCNMLSEPIYLDSITIGSLFQLDHSQRALYDRAKCVTNEPDWISYLQKKGYQNEAVEVDNVMEQGELKNPTENIDPFRVNAPHILTVTDQDERCPGKASSFSGNWILGETSFEIVSTSKGLKIDNSPSRLSKRSLLQSFLRVFKWVPFICPEDGMFYYNEMKSLHCYPDNAIGAVNYQRKKIALFKFFEQQNFGRWIGKPLEQDWFGVKLPL